ncbi:hypothetical protein [Mycoplasma struthionis]|uniref:Uncharacterized protein n=1 Tax=Mycoplasma struthionis TaxID=538220 RepID=A0A3G8LJC0_9MOLU|nr:hypothetical protein [Mycoplasma struthionis]AZG68960.1 hypothetical protein EGN60_03385 [Mycoplasma struthionis]
MSLFGNVLFQDERRFLRFGDPFKFTFNVKELQNHAITKEFSTNALDYVNGLTRKNAPGIKLILKAELNGEGIVFSLKPEKVEYKILFHTLKMKLLDP